METKGTVLLKSATELKAFTKGEENMLRDSIKAIKESGAQVVVCGGKISDLGLDYANQMGLMVVRLVSKWDMSPLAPLSFRVCRRQPQMRWAFVRQSKSRKSVTRASSRSNAPTVASALLCCAVARTMCSTIWSDVSMMR